MASSLRQMRALAIVPKVTASMSIMGSVFIITDILKSREKMGRTYSRILLVMSTYDFFTSFAQGMSTWPVPKGTEGVVYASGTTFTCNFQGFFTQLGVGAPMYNCSLSFYYLMVIAFAYSENKVKKTEWFMHGIPLLFSFATAAAGLPLTLYNSAGLWCWISALPGSCGNDPESTGECIRGDNAWVYRWAIYYVPVWLCVLTITVNMAIVSYLVWVKEKASLRFHFGNKSGLTSISVGSEVEHSDPLGDDHLEEAARAKAKANKLAQYFAQKQSKKQKERKGLASQVFWQAFYYVLAFYITWITPSILRTLQTLRKPVPYWIIVAMAALLPLQGFFNFLVYVRPRIVQYQHRHPEKSLWSAISRAIQRTLTVFYISESRTFHDTELQDIEVLDPCYALQNEQEQEKLEEKERKTRKSSQDKNVTVGEQGNQHDDPFHYDDDDGTDITNIVKTPIILNESASRLEKRRLDELKLLEEDDPSFYEGNGSRRYDLSEDLSEEEKCDMSDHSEGDVYLEDGPQIEHKDTDKNLYQMISPGIATKDESEHTEERRQKVTKKCSALENYFYPEFSSDPDFYFM